MADDLKEEKDLEGQDAIVFSKNSFRYDGKVKRVGPIFIKIFDKTKRKMKRIPIDNISEVESDE